MIARFLKSVVAVSDIPASSAPEVALLGRSNVGKSSLINHLANAKELAFTSAKPGHTQTINLYDFDGKFRLVDLPGYGFHRIKRSAGKGFLEMVGAYLSHSPKLALVLLIIDARHGMMDSDVDAQEQLVASEMPYAIVLNKTDKISNSDTALALRRLRDAFPDVPVIPHSTENSKGLGEIRTAIEDAIRAA
jgi:GTP-binding protein